MCLGKSNFEEEERMVITEAIEPLLVMMSGSCCLIVLNITS